MKHFSGSTTEDMKSHIQSLLRRDPDRVIIYNNNIYIIITFFILGEKDTIFKIKNLFTIYIYKVILSKSKNKIKGLKPLV